MLQDHELHMVERALKLGNNSIQYDVSISSNLSDLRVSIVKLDHLGGFDKLYTVRINELDNSKPILLNKRYAICLLYILREVSLSHPLLYRLKEGNGLNCFRALGKGVATAKAIIPMFKKPNKFVRVKTTSITRGHIKVYNGPKDGPLFTLSYSSVLDDLLFKDTTHEQNI